LTIPPAAGVAPATPYDCRHGYASLLIHAGRSPVEVATLLGHSRPSLVLDRYAHDFAQAADETPRDVVGAVLDARSKARTELRSCCDLASGIGLALAATRPDAVVS
jgi:hypothetical protein